MRYHYHGLKPSTDEGVNDYTDLTCYDKHSIYPLMEMWNPKTGLGVRQFLQITINNSNNSIHMFLALQDMEGTIIQDSLWSLEEVNEYITKAQEA